MTQVEMILLSNDRSIIKALIQILYSMPKLNKAAAARLYASLDEIERVLPSPENANGAKNWPTEQQKQAVEHRKDNGWEGDEDFR